MANLWQHLTGLWRTGGRGAPPVTAAAGEAGGGMKLYVSGFTAGVGTDDLRELFSRYGTVAHVEVSADPQTGLSRGFAFVDMSRGAAAALEALHGASFRSGTLVVNEAEPYPPGRGPLHQILNRLTAHADRPHSPELRQALSDLRALAETGDPEAAQELAEELARPGPHYDPEAAYKWYYVALAQQGYTVQFDDRNGSPPHYGGPAGDFRNESGVSALVSELGFDRVRALDAEAAWWLADRNLAGD